jgi:putative oxidoreductase
MYLPANDSVGKLVLRLVTGFVVLCHGIAKLTGGVDFITAMLGSHGLPGFLAYGVYIGEVVAPVLLIAGFYARWGALVVAINMIVAVWLAHTAMIFALSQQGGWALELQGLILFNAVALVFLGPGRYSLNDK